MIETIHLLPPDVGPRSNPVLFGVAMALAEILPPASALPAPTRTMRDDCAPASGERVRHVAADALLAGVHREA